MKASNLPSWHPHGLALTSYWNGNKEVAIKIHMTDGSVTAMPIEIYFRNEKELPEIEKIALEICKGKVLDVGAGAGAHSLILQQRGFDVTALDVSAQGVDIMKKLGVKNSICEDFLHYTSIQKYDTLLYLMNGIGISGTIEGLSQYLKKSHTLLSSSGQIILDSSDLRNGEIELDFNQEYFGVFNYQLEFDEQFGKAYNWLYIDQELLIKIAHENAFHCKIIYEQEDGGYLAKLFKI